jgi:hypothetical protein
MKFMKINYALTIMTFHKKPANQNNTGNSDHLIIKYQAIHECPLLGTKSHSSP